MAKSKPKRKPHAIYFEKPSLARPSFAAECDINNIIERFTRTGIMPGTRGTPQYGDAPDQTLYEAALIQAEIRSAEHLAEFAQTASEAPQEPETAQEAQPTPKSPEADTGALSASEAPQDASDAES